jgi:hypothetical protein
MDIAGCSLAELINDPLTGLVMKSDGVDRRELQALLERVARKRLLATRLANPCWPRPLTAETAPRRTKGVASLVSRAKIDN